MTLPKQIFSWGVMDEGERIAVQTEEGEVETREQRWKEAELKICYCVRQLRRRREGDWRLDRRAFKVTTVCYLTCCGHVTRLMEEMRGRPCLAASPTCFFCVSPSMCLLCVCGWDRAFCLSLAIWLWSHTVSDFACLPAWVDQSRPDCRALPGVDVR